MTLEQFTEVWTPLSLTVAIATGFLFGFAVLGAFSVDPAYANRETSVLEAVAWTAITLAAIGMVFYGGQIITSWIAGDTSWTRVVSRYAIWTLYSVAIGLGLGIRLWRHLRRKHTEAHDRAVVIEQAAEE